MQEPAIRLYCVSLPGTERRSKAIRTLSKLTSPWEFVSGIVADADCTPVHRCTGMYRYTEMLNPDCPYCNPASVVKSYGCKLAMIAAARKFLNDGGEWALIIQDDLVLYDNYYETCMTLIDNCPQEIGAIAGCSSVLACNNTILREDDFFLYPTLPYYTDPCLLLRKNYAIANAISMETLPYESDWCHHLGDNTLQLAYSKLPLGYLAHVPSTID